MDNLSRFVLLFPKFISDIFNSFDPDIRKRINEIRLRKGKPIIIYVADKCFFIGLDGSLSKTPGTHSLVISEADFESVCDKICNNSYHTNMQSLIHGFVTATDGSRIGAASSAVYKNGELYCVRDISSLCIRIAHEYINCAKPAAQLVCDGGLPSVIVAGKPGCGKTTFLRDYARLISNGFCGGCKKVCIVDERREIAGDFDVGVNTDVLFGFKKADGIEAAVRTLAPELIVCDEIGSVSELEAIQNAFSSGVSFAVSIHIKDEKSILSNEILSGLVYTHMFDFIILLKNYANEFEIIDLGEIGHENGGNVNDYPFFFLPWIGGGGE